MTAFAISSGGIEYYDQKTGGSVNATLDTYTISNESTLVIRTDTYACANHSSAFGSLDNVLSSGTGGEIIIDPTYIRYVAYTGGSGNSPAFGAAISQGSVSGVFLGVWADWQSEPIVPGAAIPASGFIKIGGVTGGSFAVGALTGIAATCEGADLQGWQEVRCAETATITIGRTGKFTGVDAWFYLAETNGIAGQVISCPTTGNIAQIWPGVWIETAPGSGAYEKFIGVGAQAPLSTTPTDDRAKFVWQTTSGLMLGFNGTNNVGYLPPAGCKVRIPAAVLTNCTRTAGSGSGPRVVPNATLGTRAEFVTNTGGYIDLKGMVIFWYANFLQPFFLNIVNSAVSSKILISRVGSFIDVNNVCIAPAQSQQAVPFDFSDNAYGANLVDISCSRFSMTTNNDLIFSVKGSRGITIENVVSRLITPRTLQLVSTFSVTSSVDVVVREITAIGAKVILQALSGADVDGINYIDSYVTTTASLPQNAIFASDLRDSVVSNLRFPYVSSPSYDYAFYSVGCLNVKFRYVGTYSLPLNGNALCAGLISFGFGTRNFKLQRAYMTSTRAGLYLSDNTNYNITLENVAGDYADANSTAYNDSVEKSVAYFASTAGQFAVYGTHWKSRFTSTTTGAIDIQCNEPTVNTQDQCAVVSGSPKFNSVGSLLATVVGQQVVWEMPFFALGHTALANSALTLAGTNTGNLNYEFQYNLGAGYNGTWLTANATNFTSVGAIDPAVGIKLKVRATCITANTGNVLLNIRINTVTTSAAQSENLYPLDTITLTFTGLVSGSDVVVRAAGTSTILASVDSNAGTTWAYVYETPVAIDVDVIKPGYVPKPLLRNYTPSAQDSSLPVSQLLDRNYI